MQDETQCCTSKLISDSGMSINPTDREASEALEGAAPARVPMVQAA
jgi:hypothetical protein